MKIEQLLFEATIDYTRKDETTDPPSEVIELEYPLPPITILDENGEEYTHSKGRTQIVLPTYTGLAPGDKIQIQVIRNL